MVNQINENALSVYTMINISINSRGLKRVRMKENLNSFISEKHFLQVPTTLEESLPITRAALFHMSWCGQTAGARLRGGRQGAGVLQSKRTS